MLDTLILFYVVNNCWSNISQTPSAELKVIFLSYELNVLIKSLKVLYFHEV